MLAGCDDQQLLTGDIGVQHGFGTKRLDEAYLRRDAVFAGIKRDVLRPNAEGNRRAGCNRGPIDRHLQSVAALQRRDSPARTG